MSKIKVLKDEELKKIPVPKKMKGKVSEEDLLEYARAVAEAQKKDCLKSFISWGEERCEARHPFRRVNRKCGCTHCWVKMQDEARV